MFILPKFVRLFLAGLALIVSAGSAWALDATANTWLNVRSGPGTGHAVVDTLYPGERVTIVECAASGWCAITRTGPDGWVSSSYLSPVVEEADPGPDCRFELTIGPSGPSFSIVCGPGGGAPPPPPPPPVTQACFYTGTNYTGAQYCREVGTSNTLGGFNNAISSVRLHGGARARLCVGTHLTGYCRTVTSNVPVLGPAINNQASSLRVFTGLLPPPPPPPPPVTHSTGPIALPPMQHADLDTGAVGGPGGDIRYVMITPLNRNLRPINGARLARGDGSNRGFAGCSAESFSTSPVPFAAIPVGTYVCVRTNQGRIAQFRVNGFTGMTLNIGYTTWAN